MKIQLIADAHGEKLKIEEADAYFHSSSWLFDLKENAYSVLGNHDSVAFFLWYTWIQKADSFKIGKYDVVGINGCVGEDEGLFFTQKEYTKICKKLQSLKKKSPHFNDGDEFFLCKTNKLYIINGV